MSRSWALIGLFVLLAVIGGVTAFVVTGESPTFAHQLAVMDEGGLPLPEDFVQRWWLDRRTQPTTQAASPRQTSTQTLYVDINAEIGGDGSQAHPYRSLATAAWEATVTGAVDAIAVAPGEYRTDVGIPPGVRLYALDSYTNTSIIGKLSMAAQTQLENFTVQAVGTVYVGGDEIVVVGNYFMPAADGASLNLSALNGFVALNLFDLPVTFSGSAAVLDNGFGEGGTISYGGAGDNLFEGNLMLGEWTLRESDELVTPKFVLANNWLINAVLHLEAYQGGRRTVTALNNHFLNAQVHESLYVQADKLVMENNIFAYTQAALYFSTGVTPTLRNNLFFGNGVNLWSAGDPVGVNGNIEADPLFVDLDGGDFRLSAESPAIDVGGSVALVRDYKGDPRPCDGNNDGTAAFDIGGDEYSAAGSCIVTTPTPLPTRMPTPTKLPPTDDAFPTDTPTSSTPTETPSPTVTATATTTPLVSATATPTPQQPGCTQLLTNPGYDEGMFGWSFVRDSEYDYVGHEMLIPAYDPQSPFGIRMAFVTTSPPGSALFVEQPLRLPAGEFVFDLHWQRRLGDPKGDVPEVRAELVDPLTGEVLDVLWIAPDRESNFYIWETAQVTFTWPAEKDVLLRIGGRSIAGDTPLYLMFDDVRLSHCADGPTVTPTPYYTPTDMPLFTPTPTATPENSSPACQQLLANSLFWPNEGGWTFWGDADIQSSLSFVSEPTIGVVPLRPEQHGITSALAQTIVIPPGRVTLFFNTKIETERLAEPVQSFQVQVRSGDGQQVLSTLVTLNTAHNWQARSFDLSGFVGQRVQIWLGGVPVSSAEPTRLNVDDVFLFSCRTDVQSGTQLYLPNISVVVPSPTPTPTQTPTSTPPTGNSLPAPEPLGSGALDRADDTNTAWYRTTSGQLISGGAAEPFPLDASIRVRGLTVSDGGLLAATDQGVYRRDKTFRWQRISEISARHIGHAFGVTWITPDEQPGQIWESVNGGAWQDVSAGLSGEVVSAVEAWTYDQYVLTLRQGYYILWRRTVDQPTWAEVAVVPGAAVTYTADGIPGSLIYRFGTPRVGSSDGKLYNLYIDENGTRWEMVHDFGAGVFPLQVHANEISAIALESGQIQAYTWQGGLEGEWVLSAQRNPALPAGANGFQKMFGASTPLHVGYSGMGLDGEGALYRYDMELENEEPVWKWRLVTTAPQRSDFIVAQLEADQVGPLYSGDRLLWTGSECSAAENGFYRSLDKGLTWTEVVSDTARQPIASIFSKPDFVIAATCTAPSITVDGGETWRSPAQLGWPLPVGAQHLFVYTMEDDNVLYAAGVDQEGTGFLLRAPFDPATGDMGTWTTITPNGMQTPEAISIFFDYVDEKIVHSIYLADAAAVWHSADDGVTWQQRNDNLNGAQVRAFYPYGNSQTESTGVLVATDKGIFLGPVAGEAGSWIATDYPYTTKPVGFAAFFPWAVYLNAEDGVFELPGDFFTYIAP